MTAEKLIHEAKRSWFPMFVRLLVDKVERGQALNCGTLHQCPQYSGNGQFVMIRTPAGPVRLRPEEITVAVWPTLPADRRNGHARQKP